MKKYLLLLFPVLMALIGVGLLSRPAAQAATVKVGCQPQTLTVRTGQTFYVSLIVTDTLDLYAWQFDTTFNKQYLEYVTLLPGNHLRSDGAKHFVVPPVLNIGTTTNEAVNAAATRLSKDFGVNGSGALAHVLFRAVKQKTDGLTIDLNDILLVDRNALEISKDYVNGADCRVIIRDNAPVLIQPPVGELIFLPTVIR
jgi:hypothetical protein